MKILKIKEHSITKNSRFTISQAEKISEYVKKHSYQNDSGFIRTAVELLMKYHDYQERFNDPDERMKFAQEIDPIIQTEKKQECLESLLINSSDKELERFYFVISQERNKRIKNKVKNEKEKMNILRCGGELEPKVGYRLSVLNNTEYFSPITPDYDEWEYLSKEDKENLLLELKQKLEYLESSEIGKSISPEIQFAFLKRKIDDISKGIYDEE